MPYINGTWVPWINQTSGLGQITNSSDPISTLIHGVTGAMPWLFPLLLGALYVYLWVLFGDSPSRFKLVGMSALVLVISIVFSAAGFTTDAVFNFIVFGIAFIASFMFRQ